MQRSCSALRGQLRSVRRGQRVRALHGVVRTVFEVEDPKDRDPCNWISDGAHVFSPRQIDEINREIHRLHEETGAQLAVVTLRDVEGAASAQDVARFARDLFDEWEIGAAKIESGMLMLYVGDRNRFQVVTGAGMRRVVPDGWMDTVLTAKAFPHFRAGQPDIAIGLAVDRCVERVRSALHAVGGSEERLWRDPLALGSVSPPPRPRIGSGAWGGGRAEANSRTPGGEALRRWRWLFGKRTGVEDAVERQFRRLVRDAEEERALRSCTCASRPTRAPPQRERSLGRREGGYGGRASKGRREDGGGGAGGGGARGKRWGEAGGRAGGIPTNASAASRWGWLVVAAVGAAILLRRARRRPACAECGGRVERVASTEPDPAGEEWREVSDAGPWRDVPALDADTARAVWEERGTDCQRRERELQSAWFDAETCVRCGVHRISSRARSGWARCRQCGCLTAQETEDSAQARVVTCRNCGQCVQRVVGRMGPGEYLLTRKSCPLPPGCSVLGARCAVLGARCAVRSEDRWLKQAHRSDDPPPLRGGGGPAGWGGGTSSGGGSTGVSW